MKSKKKTRSSIYSKKLTKKKFMNLEYPYRHLEITKNQMLKDFNKLKKYKPIIIRKHNKKITKYNNQIIIFKEIYNLNKELYSITDYFSHKCRTRCIFNLREDQNMLDLFQENKKKILIEFEKKKLDITYHNINEYLFNNFSQCTNFNTTIVVSILHFFKPEKVLDFSAGWGDRLVGAIAYDCEYLGIDPSNCMNPNYKKIINTLCSSGKKKQYKIIKSGFEDVETKKNYYDLVFTSPPFFDLEVYEDSDTQSIEKFNTVDKWKTNFLFPCIKKSFESLKKNKHLALYITDYKNNYYIKDMKDYIKYELGYKYEGNLYWMNNNNNKNLRTVFVWKK
jgi:hypothetical protein